MYRRSFLQGIVSTAATALMFRSMAFGAPESPRLAITIDDPRVTDAGGFSGDVLNQKILGHLSDARLKAALFVCGMRVDSDAGKDLLSTWNDAGHVIGNHSYSHKYFHSSKVTLDDFTADAAKGEAVVRAYPRFRKSFRFPFFKEGNTPEKRDGMRAWLKKNGYSQGRATIDASDWAIDARMLRHIKDQPEAKLDGYRDFYLEHIWERAQYYDLLAKKALGSSPHHTILLHHNLLNALFLGDLLKMFRQKGWRLIDAEEAYRDSVYKREPDILPAGESLVWAIAKETGKYETLLRYPGEDGPYEDPRMDELGL